MRRSHALLAVVVLVSLACGGGRGGATVRDKACATACAQGRERCDAQCPDGLGSQACEAACKKVEGECVDRCEK